MLVYFIIIRPPRGARSAPQRAWFDYCVHICYPDSRIILPHGKFKSCQDNRYARNIKTHPVGCASRPAGRLYHRPLAIQCKNETLKMSLVYVFVTVFHFAKQVPEHMAAALVVGPAPAAQKTPATAAPIQRTPKFALKAPYW